MLKINLHHSDSAKYVKRLQVACYVDYLFDWEKDNKSFNECYPPSECHAAKSNYPQKSM